MSFYKLMSKLKGVVSVCEETQESHAGQVLQWKGTGAFLLRGQAWGLQTCNEDDCSPFFSTDRQRAARPEHGLWSQRLTSLCKKVSACNTSNPGSETGHTGSPEGQKSCCDARQKLFLQFPDSSHSSEIHQLQFNWQETTAAFFSLSLRCIRLSSPPPKKKKKGFPCIILYKDMELPYMLPALRLIWFHFFCHIKHNFLRNESSTVYVPCELRKFLVFTPPNSTPPRGKNLK